MNNEHTEYYEEMLRIGLEYQDFILEQLSKKLGLAISIYSASKNQVGKGESVQGIEIKYDRGLQQYNRLFIEISEKTDADNLKFVRSGIFRGSWLYIIGDYERAYIFPTKYLRRLYQPRKWLFKEIPTAQGYVMPLSDAERYCINRMEFGEKDDPSPFLITVHKESV